jgi:hypothetical protein
MRLGACAPVVVSPICDVHVTHAASYRAVLGHTRVHLVLHRQRVDGHTDTPRVLSLIRHVCLLAWKAAWPSKSNVVGQQRSESTTASGAKGSLL